MVAVQALKGAHDGLRSFTVIGPDALPIGAIEDRDPRHRLDGPGNELLRVPAWVIFHAG